ncbi:hypothetical protein [Marinigracilibium pacificum]|uniref:DUF4235 domain-containing protein n=1 Tax=Marinigracilibium pacificum TaxID=2729599 RepID=A0A848IVL6_9BACT|nr:hypothetical protein [Marinigracilibium pacificum]NMM47325.1 hypothetical protein [Marinigracilibium pacificum]
MKISKNEILYSLGALVVSYGLKEGIKYGYKKIYGRPLPNNPVYSGVATSQALFWTLGLSAAGGLAKLYYRKKMSALKES